MTLQVGEGRTVNPAPIVVVTVAAAIIAIIALSPVQQAAAADREVRYLPSGAISNPSGAAVFATHCASCHGEDGTGNAVARAAVGRQIPDLTKIALRYGEFDRLHVMAELQMSGIAHTSTEDMPCWTRALRGMDDDPHTQLLIARNLVRHLEGLQQPASYQVAELGLRASH